MADLAELRALVARHARDDGRCQSAIPELWFYRSARPLPYRRGQCPSLFLAVVVQGRKVARIDARELHYDADSYLVVTDSTPFESTVVEASPQRPYLSIGIQLPPEQVVKTVLSLGDGVTAAAPSASAYVSRLDQPLLDALCRLVRTLDDPAEQRVVAPLAIAELVFRLLRSDWAAAIRAAATRDGDHARITQAMTFMRANLARRLSVAAIARHVAMSPSHFAHRFRDVARMSPMQYLKHVRLLEARWLVLEGGGAGEVATRVGYASAAHFSRDFRERFALPPGSYARQFRSQDPARGSQAAPSP